MKALLLMTLALSACAPVATLYAPQVLARGEMSLAYEGHFVMSAEGKVVTRGLTYPGLANFVRCSPKARVLAEEAHANGRSAVAFAIAGGILGGSSLGALAAFASPDPNVRVAVLASGVAVAVLGTVFGGLSHRFKNFANGQAIDAMNIYNDEIGAWGGTCSDPP